MSREGRILRLEDVAVRLGVFELADVTFEVAPGEVVGYLGHNGAGKSTTFRVIADLVRPVAGAVRLGRLDHRENEREFKRRVSVIGDNSHVYASMRIDDALAFASSFYPRWDDAWCTRMCDELQLPRRTRVRHLSTGMRTKLGFVLGLSPRPEMVVLDEPTSGLDVESAEWVWQVIDAQVAAGDLGALVSSHSRDEVFDHCSRVLVLSNGRIVEQIDLHLDRGQAGAELDAAMGKGKARAD